VFKFLTGGIFEQQVKLLKLPDKTFSYLSNARLKLPALIDNRMIGFP